MLQPFCQPHHTIQTEHTKSLDSWGPSWEFHTQVCSVPHGTCWGYICMSEFLGDDSEQEDCPSHTKSHCSPAA